MFTDEYTFFNNEEERKDGQHSDPLNLKNCLRLFPHDGDNMGGFFVAVFEKILDDPADGFVYDELYQMNPWENHNVVQKGIMDDIKDFVEEYEKGLEEYEKQKGVPEAERSKGAFKELVEEAKQESAHGLEMGNLTEQKNEKDAEKQKEFQYVKLLEHKPEVWYNLKEFYGISDDFPKELLYF